MYIKMCSLVYMPNRPILRICQELRCEWRALSLNSVVHISKNYGVSSRATAAIAFCHIMQDLGIVNKIH